jgi:glycosyltransferase involved in cell wall biosynthesis
MRISLVDPSAFTPPYDHSLAAGLARAGADVELITSRFAYGPTPPADGFETVEMFYRRASAMSPASRARLVVKGAEHLPGMARLAAHRVRARPDVVHYQWLTAPAVDRYLIGAFGPRLARRRPPRVYTVHYPLPTDARRLRREGRLLRSMDLVISHSEYGARRIVGDAGVPEARVRVIPHGAFDYLTRLPDERPLPDELAAEGPVVLFFGLLRPYKGIDVLIDAFSRLDAGAELWIAGMPRMPVEPLREAAQRAAGRVRFIPRFVPDPEIPALMRRADVLVLPYREIEQSGVLYTGLAFGKPMVLTAVGGFVEVAREHHAARLVAPGDADELAVALEQLLADPAERRRLGDAARAAAEGPYSWDTIAHETLDAYNELLSQRR